MAVKVSFVKPGHARIPSQTIFAYGEVCHKLYVIPKFGIDPAWHWYLSTIKYKMWLIERMHALIMGFILRAYIFNRNKHTRRQSIFVITRCTRESRACVSRLRFPFRLVIIMLYSSASFPLRNIGFIVW